MCTPSVPPRLIVQLQVLQPISVEYPVCSMSNFGAKLHGEASRPCCGDSVFLSSSCQAMLVKVERDVLRAACGA